MSTEIRAHLIIDGEDHPEWCGEGSSFSEAINSIAYHGDEEGQSKTLFELVEEQPNNTIKAVVFVSGTPQKRIIGSDEFIEIISG